MALFDDDVDELQNISLSNNGQDVILGQFLNGVKLV